MRKLIYLAIFLLIGISCFAQEVEVCGSLNTSSEQRFQNALGIGLQYQHDISRKFKVGLGVHYNFKNSHFTEQPYIDAIPFPPSIEKFDSKSNRFSIRLNIQNLLRDNENLSISLGPEISYNYLWGQDNIKLFKGGGSNWDNFKQSNGLIKKIGIGVLSKIEIKDFITPRLSLCLTIRPEFTTNDEFGESVFARTIGFVEFQMGLKYRFKNPA